MKNLKDYRNNELKWFLFANVLLMIISSGMFAFEETMDSWVTGISTLLNITAFSSAIYILTFLFDSVVPSHVKVVLVFLWKKQPSCTIFTDMEKKMRDNRFTLSEAKKKYAKEYEEIQEKSSDFDQTPLWYKIYNRNRDNTIVFGSNRDYLLLRDMHSQTITLLLTYTILCYMLNNVAISWEYILYLLAMIVLLNISAKVKGKRLMYHVLSVDINNAKEINKDSE